MDCKFEALKILRPCTVARPAHPWGTALLEACMVTKPTLSDTPCFESVRYTMLREYVAATLPNLVPAAYVAA